MKWLEEVQKGCSDKYLFYFLGRLRATGFPVEPTWLFIFSFGLKLVHVDVSTFVCNREVLNRDFLVQILAPSVYVSGGSRPGHKVPGTRSKFPNLNENAPKSHFLRGFSDLEPGQHFVKIRHCMCLPCMSFNTLGQGRSCFPL